MIGCLGALDRIWEPSGHQVLEPMGKREDILGRHRATEHSRGSSQTEHTGDNSLRDATALPEPHTCFGNKGH